MDILELHKQLEEVNDNGNCPYHLTVHTKPAGFVLTVWHVIREETYISYSATQQDVKKLMGKIKEYADYN